MTAAAARKICRSYWKGHVRTMHIWCCWTAMWPISRLVRRRDAAFYLGMDRNRFNAEVRPFLTEIPIGEQGIAFDRLDLDAWADGYVSRNGRPGRPMGVLTWDAKDHRVSSNAVRSGTSISKSAGGEFAEALAQVISKRRSATSRGCVR